MRHRRWGRRRCRRRLSRLATTTFSRLANPGRGFRNANVAVTADPGKAHRGAGALSLSGLGSPADRWRDRDVFRMRGDRLDHLHRRAFVNVCPVPVVLRRR